MDSVWFLVFAKAKVRHEPEVMRSALSALG